MHDVSEHRKERERMMEENKLKAIWEKSGQTSLAGEDNCCVDIADKLEKGS